MFPGQCDFPPNGLSCIANAGTEHQQNASPEYCAGFSRYRQDLIPNKVEADPRRPWAIKEECGGCFNRIFPQFVPCIPLREDVFRKAFSAIPAISFLNNLKHQFGHMLP
jgi:hypothetical protein